MARFTDRASQPMETRTQQSGASRLTPSATGLASRAPRSGWYASDPMVDRIGLVASLANAIEHEVLPRLIRSHVDSPAKPRQSLGPVRGSYREEVLRLVRLLRDHRRGEAQALVESARLRSTSASEVLKDLLTPAARYLGELWEQDLCDFVDVTDCVGQMQAFMRPMLEGEVDLNLGARAPRIFLATAPGEMHCFGLAMVAHYFRCDGWDVVTSSWTDGSDPLLEVQRGKFDMIGLSAGSAQALTGLATFVSGLRLASRRKPIPILVGGPIFLLHPEFGIEVGADATAKADEQAVTIARRMLPVSSPPAGLHPRGSPPLNSPQDE